MHQFSYAEFVDDSPAVMRDQERQTMDRAIELLRYAQETPPGSPVVIEALFFLQRLWGIFATDLADSNNELPIALRANLLSIGAWVAKEIDRVRTGQTTDLAPLIDINEIIREGLK